MIERPKPSGPIGMIEKPSSEHEMAKDRIPNDVLKNIDAIDNALSNNKILPIFSEKELMKIYEYSPDIATFCLLIYPKEKGYETLKAKIKGNPEKINHTLRYYFPMI